MRTNRRNLTLAGLGGCVTASLVGLLLAFKYGSPTPARVAATILPAFACYIGGPRVHLFGKG